VSGEKPVVSRPQTIIDAGHGLAIDQAMAQFLQIARERDGLTRKLVSIRRHILTLARFTESNEQTQRFLMNIDELIWPPHGTTDAVRFALRYSGECMTGKQIKDFLEEKGFDWHRYTNPAAAVRNSILSMIKRGEASDRIQKDGTKTFRYVPKQDRLSRRDH
jgi:hypothetical protein